MSYDGGVQDRRVPLSRIKLKKTHTTPYDVADHLHTPQQIAEYLDACFEEADCDAAFIAKAIGDVARAKGIAHIAKESGLSRESLYKALSGDRNPNLDTVLKVLSTMDLRLRAVPAGL
jgi:probable addiction module antidote protein